MVVKQIREKEIIEVKLIKEFLKKKNQNREENIIKKNVSSFIFYFVSLSLTWLALTFFGGCEFSVFVAWSRLSNAKTINQPLFSSTSVDQPGICSSFPIHQSTYFVFTVGKSIFSGAGNFRWCQILFLRKHEKNKPANGS